MEYECADPEIVPRGRLLNAPRCQMNTLSTKFEKLLKRLPTYTLVEADDHI